MKKYYKVVYPGKDGVLTSHKYDFKYKPNVWHKKSETATGNSFFVFTTVEEAKTFNRQFGCCKGEIWECKVRNPRTYDKELGYIHGYKQNAVFASSVMLTKKYVETPLVSGMIFRMTGTKDYYVFDKDECELKSVASSDFLVSYISTGYTTVEELVDDCNLVYCPNAKLKLTFGKSKK